MPLTTQDVHKVLLVDSNGDPLIVAGQDLATAAKQDTGNTSLASIDTKLAGSGSLISIGNVAHDAVDSGNPVKIGGKASSTAPTNVSEGDRADIWTSLKGAVVVTTQPTTVTPGDSSSNSVLNLSNSGGTSIFALATYPQQYNGTGWERYRGQAKETILASAARTVATSANLTLYNNCALLLVVDVTARAAATTLTPSLIMGQTGFVANKTIWTAAAAINSASGTFMYVFWPFPTIGSPVGYVEVVNTPLFRELQVTITPNDANSVTYSVIAYTALVG